MGAQKNVKEFALIGFVLLAVLFGMQIMTFIFGNLGSIDQFPDAVQTTTNETEAWVNETDYTVDRASDSNFTGVTVTTIWGAQGGKYNVTIPSANYTVNSATGVITNATDTTYSNVSVSYTSTHKTEAEVTIEGITNDSLHAIGKYAEQSGTQFTTLGIAITLVILVAVFLFFWVAFMGKKKGSGPGSFS